MLNSALVPKQVKQKILSGHVFRLISKSENQRSNLLMYRKCIGIFKHTRADGDYEICKAIETSKVSR